MKKCFDPELTPLLKVVDVNLMSLYQKRHNHTIKHTKCDANQLPPALVELVNWDMHVVVVLPALDVVPF